jgi:Flp pilus assembly pilin Flp
MRAYVRLSQRKGQTMGEYAIVVAAIAAACYSVYITLGGIIDARLALVTALF